MRPRWAVLVVAALALSGCGGIPTTGSVVPGSLFDEESGFDVAFDPNGPQPGATPQQILDGFILAATNPADGYQVARSFLDESIQSTWDPDYIMQIRSGIGVSRMESDTEGSYSLTSSAYVNARGQYVAESATQTLPFTFAQNADGEWRISSAPPGIVLSQATFNTIFEAHPLYFFDPSNKFLVPDLRWFPRTSKLATRIVTELLKGPLALWVAGGVTSTYFPSGTELASSVITTADAATVDLDATLLDAPAEQLPLMEQQLRATLGSVSEISLRVNGIPATIHPQVASQLLVRQDDSFGFLSGSGSVSALAGQSTEILQLGATDAALASDQKSTAVLAPDGVHLVVEGDGDALLLDSRPGLIAPAIDNAGFVWTVPASDATAIQVYDPQGNLTVIDGAQFAGQAISLTVSRDGARVLMLFATDLGPRLSVAGIVRRDGVPTQLGAAESLPVESRSLGLDAAWVDENIVALLADTEGDGSAEVTLYTLGGPSVSAGRVTSGVAIVGGNGGPNGLRVLTANGDVYLPRGNGWADMNTSVTFIGTQQ
jgi:spore germination protein GerM